MYTLDQPEPSNPSTNSRIQRHMYHPGVSFFEEISNVVKKQIMPTLKNGDFSAFYNRKKWTKTNILTIIAFLKRKDNVLVRVMDNNDKIIEEGIVNYYTDTWYHVIYVNETTFSFEDETQNYTYYYIVKPKNIKIEPITFEQIKIKQFKKQCKLFNILITYENNKDVELIDNKYMYDINGDDDDIDKINVDEIGLDVKFYMLSDYSSSYPCIVSGGKMTRRRNKKITKKVKNGVKSINCNHPKCFSQKQYCKYGKNKF